MTDNRATELREKLNKLIIELDRLDITLESPVSDMTLGEYEQEREKLLDGFIQAIAATLESGTCHMSFIDEYETASGEEEYLCECSECGYRRWEHAHDLPLFCSKCGRKVKR